MTARTPIASTVHEPLGKPGGPGLFHHKGLQLPAYIQHVAHELLKKGKTESQAIQMAIGIVKNWAEGKGGVHPDVRAAAAAAVAQWEKAKASTRLSGSGGRVVADLVGPKGYTHGWVKVGITVAHKDGSYGVVRAYDPNTQTIHADWFHGPRAGKANKTTTKAYHTQLPGSSYLGSEASKKDPTIARTPEEVEHLQGGGNVEAFRKEFGGNRVLDDLAVRKQAVANVRARAQKVRDMEPAAHSVPIGNLSSKPALHTATYKGQTETRTSKAEYTHAAVYRVGADNREVIGSFHKSAVSAWKGSNGMKPIAVVPVTRGVEEPALSDTQQTTLDAIRSSERSGQRVTFIQGQRGANGGTIGAAAMSQLQRKGHIEKVPGQSAGLPPHKQVYRTTDKGKRAAK